MNAFCSRVALSTRLRWIAISERDAKRGKARLGGDDEMLLLFRSGL